MGDLHTVEIIRTQTVGGEAYPTVRRLRVTGGWVYEFIAYNQKYGERRDFLIAVSVSTSFVPEVTP